MRSTKAASCCATSSTSRPRKAARPAKPRPPMAANPPPPHAAPGHPQAHHPRGAAAAGQRCQWRGHRRLDRGQRGRRRERAVAVGARGEAEARGAAHADAHRQGLYRDVEGAEPAPVDAQPRPEAQRRVREELREAPQEDRRAGAHCPHQRQPPRAAEAGALRPQPPADDAGGQVAAAGRELPHHAPGLPRQLPQPRDRPELARQGRQAVGQGLEGLRQEEVRSTSRRSATRSG